jgi:chromosome segregation ATPase
MVAKIKKLEIQNEEGKAAEGALQATVALFEEKLHLRNEEITADKRKSEERRIKAEEKVMYLQLQLNNVKGREESANHDGIVIKKELEKMREMIQEREEVIAQRKELIEALQNKLFESENSTVLLRQKIAEVERNLSASQLLKDEKEGLLVALRRDVRALTEGKELAAKRMQELEDFKLRTETANNKILGIQTTLHFRHSLRCE